MDDFLTFSERVEITHNYHLWLKDCAYAPDDSPLTFLTYLTQMDYIDLKSVKQSLEITREGDNVY